jgi:hypothetical protein
VRAETIASANELLLKVHAHIPLVAARGDGHIATVDGMRFRRMKAVAALEVAGSALLGGMAADQRRVAVDCDPLGRPRELPDLLARGHAHRRAHQATPVSTRPRR